MSFNIVDLIKEQITDKTMDSIGGALGVQGTQASMGLAGALPGLLSGLASSAGTKQGAGALFDAVQKQDDGILGNMGNLLGGNNSSSLASAGSSTLSSLLGSGAVGSLAGVVSNLAGIGRGSSGSLLGMLVPVILGVLKKKVLDGGMDSSSMVNMLTSQKDNISAAMPKGFSDQLDSVGFFNSIADSANQANQSATQSSPTNSGDTSRNTEHTGPANTEAKGSAGFMKWLIPVAVVAVLGWLAMQFFGGKNIEEVGNGALESVSENAGSAVDGALESVGDALPEGVNLDEITGGLDGVFSTTTEALGGITDVESATAAIPALEEIGGNLGGLSDTIGGLPDAVKGPISSIIGSGIEVLQPLIEKVTAIPGVGDVITPVIEPMMQMLQGLAG